MSLFSVYKLKYDDQIESCFFMHFPLQCLIDSNENTAHNFERSDTWYLNNWIQEQI